MVSVNETTRTAEWLYDTLTGDGPLVTLIGANNVHDEHAPNSASFPCVVYSLLAPTDVTTSSVERIMTSDLWLVKGIARASSYASLSGIADAIDRLLHRSAGGVAGADGVVFTSQRDRAFRLPEITDGVEFRHLGGVYETFTQVA